MTKKRASKPNAENLESPTDLSEIPSEVTELNSLETVVDDKAPVNIPLERNEPKDEKSDEETRELITQKVQTSIREKLSRKNDSEAFDPFVPQSQVDNEVVQVSREKGFPLSRGTEIGARLLARSKRNNK